MRFLLLLSLIATSSLVVSDDEEHPLLNCNSLTGDLRWKMIRFSRSMEPGDTLTVTGTVYNSANMSYIHLYEGFNNVYEVGKVSLHIRTQFRNPSIIYNSYFGSWGREEFSSLPYKPGQRYTVTIVKYPFEWKVYNGNQLLKTYGIRHPATWSIGNLLIYGDWSADAVTMLCKRPPVTVAATTPVITTPAAVPTTPAATVPPNPVASDPGKGTDIIGNATVPGGAVVNPPKESDEPSIGGGDLPSGGNSGNNNGKGNSGNNAGKPTYPPGLFPPGFDPSHYNNGNGQPNIIIINQAPPPAPKRRNRGPKFMIDGSSEDDDDEDCECEED